MSEGVANISVRTQAEADCVQALFQQHREHYVIKKVEAGYGDDGILGVIFTLDDGSEFHHRIDKDGSRITDAFFGGGLDSWLS